MGSRLGTGAGCKTRTRSQNISQEREVTEHLGGEEADQTPRGGPEVDLSPRQKGVEEQEQNPRDGQQKSQDDQ